MKKSTLITVACLGLTLVALSVYSQIQNLTVNGTLSAANIVGVNTNSTLSTYSIINNGVYYQATNSTFPAPVAGYVAYVNVGGTNYWITTTATNHIP